MANRRPTALSSLLLACGVGAELAVVVSAGMLLRAAVRCNFAWSAGSHRQVAAPMCVRVVPLLGLREDAAIGLPAAMVLAGYLASVCAAARRSWRTRQRLRKLPLVQPSADQRSIAAGVGVKRLRVIDTEAMVCLCGGLIRPAVYVSRGVLQTFTEPMLIACLAHEAAHAHRAEPLRSLLRWLVSVLAVMLPAVRVSVSHLATCGEIAADDAALRTAGRPALLAAVAAFLEATTTGSIRPAFTTGISDCLDVRLTYLVTGKRPRIQIGAGSAVLTGLSVTVLAAAGYFGIADGWLRPAIESALHIVHVQ
jgi:beta-lactamase regulating signal transducer with metallopeptidase domain